MSPRLRFGLPVPRREARSIKLTGIGTDLLAGIHTFARYARTRM